MLEYSEYSMLAGTVQRHIHLQVNLHMQLMVQLFCDGLYICSNNGV